LDEIPAALVTDAANPGGMKLHMKGFSTGLARSPSGEATDQFLLCYVEAHSGGE
jgi:hypothetical protein